MPLSRYAAEVQGVVEEMRYLLDRNLMAVAHDLADRLGEDGFFVMSDDEQDKALKFLSQTPSQHRKAIDRLSDEEAVKLVLRARYLGMMSARAISFADGFTYMPGSGYRAAAAAGARKALGAHFEPSLQAVLPGGHPPENDARGPGLR